MLEIPLALKHAIESGECVLFIGSGIGKHVFNKEGKNCPTGMELANSMIEDFKLGSVEDYDLSKISQFIEITKGRKELESYLRTKLLDFEPDAMLKWLFTLRWRAIFTTNYDYVIERCYDLNEKPPQNCLTISLDSEIVNYDVNFQVPIFHIHGRLWGVQDYQIIITEADYARFRVKRSMLVEHLKTQFATSTFLYLGYSNKDYNWRILLEEIKHQFYPSNLPISFKISPNKDFMNEEILKADGIETLNCNFADFCTATQKVIDLVRIEPDNLKRIKSQIPSDFTNLFDKNPAPVIRLTNSWTYVNQAPFNENPNLLAFLMGDKPSWALVGSEKHFERDIEEQVFEELLDFATSNNPKTSIRIILGSAGYGITTLLMSLATKLVKETGAGYVFMHKIGSQLNEGDFDFARSFLSGPLFFFIDNAADYSGTINTVIQKFKESNKVAMFVLGERTNEWRQSHGKLNGPEYALEALSDPEIIRLLKFLEDNGALNQLEFLTYEQRFAVIKQKHGKELLVVLREATENRNFDAILEDEHRNINNIFSQKLYLTVCCFYQDGALVRDYLLSQLMGTSLVDLYKQSTQSTEGIIIYEEIDPSKGFFAARARHRTIAAVVWERCGNIAEKEEILQRAIESLNLTYKIDRDAFEYFIRSDRLIDSIGSFDGKTKFFDTACKKDPENAYVRQHYSRMLRRAGKSDLAFGQIEDAIKLNPKLRVLYHSKGEVLSDLAASIESEEIARRRMVQAEQNYRIGISMYNKDEYCYQGLAELYFEWAKRVNDPNEKASYITKSEEVISEGLKVVNVGEALWIVSSNIQDYLGHQPASYAALEKAVEDSPKGIFARYLLGRALRRNGKPDDAIKIFEPIIRTHFDEYRVFIEYALCIIHKGEPYKKAIAIMEQSSLYGLSDARFIAILGGLYVMDNQISSSERVFQEAHKHQFTASELNKVFFKPPDSNNSMSPMCITGKVIKVKAGYSWVESRELPVALCPGSKFNGLLMKENMLLTFEPSFTAKGLIADNPLKI